MMSEKRRKILLQTHVIHYRKHASPCPKKSKLHIAGHAWEHTDGNTHNITLQLFGEEIHLTMRRKIPKTR